jgi:4-amino-4-deoxy-L-arabinose transferase-like glycosyltransferase
MRRSDLLWIAAAALLLVATGIGFRDPWPADEPRFALVARDMLHFGDWLFPRVGGDLYQDKPPFYFWLLAASYGLMGSLRWAFLLPSLLASFGTLLLVYDLGRRIAGRNAAFLATLTLVGTVQFLTTSRSAQIDATLTFLTTLSLYGLLRHLLYGPNWKCYFLGGFAAGLGVITKGVGFLPLLIFIPYAYMRRANWQQLASINNAGWRWALAPAAFLLAIAIWLLPMLLAVATRGTEDLIAYRNEILFQQTVTRYAAAWHHARPWYYLFTQIPLLWFPLSFLAIWLVPRWRQAWRDKDSRVCLPLLWIVMVVIFFSASSGKRGIYLNPALPALALAAAPYLAEVLKFRSIRIASVIASGILLLAACAFLAANALGVKFAVTAVTAAGLATPWPLWLFVTLSAVGLFYAQRRQPIIAWHISLAALAIAWSYGIAPAMNNERTTKAFIREVQTTVGPREELGLVAYKEQFLLHITRPIVNFGHRRTGEGLQEAYDAAAWQNAGINRVLLLPEPLLTPCFLASTPQALRTPAAGEAWYLVRGTAANSCIQQGLASRAISYEAPGA